MIDFVIKIQIYLALSFILGLSPIPIQLDNRTEISEGLRPKGAPSVAAGYAGRPPSTCRPHIMLR